MFDNSRTIAGVKHGYNYVVPRRIPHPDIGDVELTEVLRALSDPIRLEIVRLAAKHPELPCNQFYEAVPKSTLSHHWRVLREAGLIRQVGQGTARLNSLRRDEIENRFPGLLEAIL